MIQARSEWRNYQGMTFRSLQNLTGIKPLMNTKGRE
jgi:hypothetical protein